jgi:predicted secreted Zn-dependent protease
MTVAMASARASGVEIVYYDITGNSAKEMRRQLNANGPLSERGARVDGHTKWTVSWTFRYAPKAASCEFTAFRSTVEGTITLPRWVANGSISNALITRWQSYISALRIHENGHYAHGVKAAEEIDSLGQSFRVSGDCSTIAKKFSDQAATIIEKYRAADETYDRRTQLGRTQGVRFP